MGPRQIFLGEPRPPHHGVSGGGGVQSRDPFLSIVVSSSSHPCIPIFGLKAGVTLRCAMISIGSGLKPRASQRCRNDCFLTLETENGARQIFWLNRNPPPCGVRGRGMASDLTAAKLNTV